MGKDLKSFLKSKGKNVDEFIEKEVPSDKRGMAKNLAEQAKQFEGQSEDQLMRQLMSYVEQGKRDGSFSSEQLSSFVKQVSPMLNEQQRKKMEAITRQIK